MLRSGLFVQHSLKYGLDHEQVLTKVKDRAISFFNWKNCLLWTVLELSGIWRLLQEGWIHMNLGKRHQLLLLTRVRAEAKTEDG